MPKMKIMIINDSKSMRLFLEDVVRSYHDCEVIGSYFDARLALNDFEIAPDVILLDLEMPKMDGITFLENLGDKKYPVIIISNYVSDNSELVTEAMNLGAIDSLALPSSNTPEMFSSFKNTLHHKIIKSALHSNRFCHLCS